ncbi:hypothetical protein SDC9_194084 [bioreactor metagenome]|uniref:Uncharacterized protein n=1 Tax=bioreactor metagenome TaxID=1076179 RepID=A0A645I5H3_9ZZZZ
MGLGLLQEVRHHREERRSPLHELRQAIQSSQRHSGLQRSGEQGSLGGPGHREHREGHLNDPERFRGGESLRGFPHWPGGRYQIQGADAAGQSGPLDTDGT